MPAMQSWLINRISVGDIFPCTTIFVPRGVGKVQAKTDVPPANGIHPLAHLHDWPVSIFLAGKTALFGFIPIFIKYFRKETWIVGVITLLRLAFSTVAPRRKRSAAVSKTSRSKINAF